MEDGQTLFDYSVGLNDIVQLLIRSQTDPPDGAPGPREPAPRGEGVPPGPREGSMDRLPAAATATPCGSNSPSPGSNSAKAPPLPAPPKIGPAHATDITSVIVNNNNNNNNRSSTVASGTANNNNNNKCNAAKPEAAVTAATNFTDAKSVSGTGSGSGSKTSTHHPAPDTQPSTSSRPVLVDPGIGVYKVRDGTN